MLNYKTKILEDLIDFSVLLEKRNMDEDLKSVALLMSLLQTAFVFSLPTNGLLFEADAQRYNPQHLRLPYASILLEYPVAMRDADGTPFNPSAVLCYDLKDIVRDIEEIRETIGIVRFIYVPEIRRWSISAFGALNSMETLSEDELGNVRMLDTDTPKKNVMPFVMGALNLMPQMKARAIATGTTELDFYQSMIGQLGHEAHILAQLLCALECKNVAVENVAAPEKLNKKRLKNGKFPLYDYHVLTLDAQPHEVHVTGQPRGAAGPRRTHLRRGHIRHLTTHNIWVNSHIVHGQKPGFTEKDYRVINSLTST